MSHVRCLSIIVAAVYIISLGSTTHKHDLTKITSQDYTPTDLIRCEWNIMDRLDKGPYCYERPESFFYDKWLYRSDVRTGYADLRYSYLFRVLLHLRLTGDLVILKPKSDTKNAGKEIEIDVTFSNEVRQILEFMHHIYIDDVRTEIFTSTLQSEVSIFWIFAVYTERVRKYATDVFNSTEEEAEARKSLTSVHAAVTRLFEECLGGCTGHNQQEGVYLKTIDERVSLAKKQKSVIRYIAENKREFSQQVDRNKRIIPMHDECNEQLKMKCMHLNNVHDADVDMTALVQHLGMFDANTKSLFVSKLRASFEVVVSNTAMLHVQMDALQRFQQDFIQILIAVALRIAQEHLECLKNSPILSVEYQSQKKAMHAVLSDFFVYLNLAAYKDPLVSKVTKAFSDPTVNLKDKYQNDCLIYYMKQSFEIHYN